MTTDTKKKATEFALDYYIKNKEWPTYEAIRSHLNYHGSNSTIKKALDDAQDSVHKHVSVTNKFPEIPEELVSLLLSVYRKSVESATSLFDSERMALNESVRLLTVEIESLKNEALLLAENEERLKSDLSSSNNLIQEQAEYINNAEKSLEYLEVEVANQQNQQDELRRAMAQQEKDAEIKLSEVKAHYDEKLALADKRNDDNERRLVARIAEEQVKREKDQKEAKTEINALIAQNTEKLVKIGVLETECQNLEASRRQVENQLTDSKQKHQELQEAITRLHDEHADYKAQHKETMESLKSLLKSKDALENELREKLDEMRKDNQYLRELAEKAKLMNTDK